MAQINGSNVVIWLDYLTPSTTPDAADKVLFTTNCTLSITHDLPDATTKDSDGWAEHISGLRSWEVTVDGLTDFGGMAGDNLYNLWQLISARKTDARMIFAVDEDDDRSASAYFYGEVSLANLELTNEMEATASFSGTLTGNGALTTTTPSGW